MDLKLRFLSGKSITSSITMTGSINNVLMAQIDCGNTKPRTPENAGYSLGLGAQGSTFEAVEHRLGELCTTPDTVGVLTAGDENIPQFTAGENSTFFTPFNVSLGGEFEEVYSFQSETPFTIGDLYAEIFNFARQKTRYKGLLGISFIFRIENFYGSLVKTTPLKGSLQTDEKIIDRGRFEKWFRIDKEPVYHGYRAVSVGVGLDISRQDFSQKSLNRIFYIHPGNVGAVDKLLHNHCFILPPGELPQLENDYNSTVFNLLRVSQVIDVKHILDNSTLSEGLLALNYIQDIEGS